MENNACNNFKKSELFKNFDGILLLNKNPGITTYDVIRELKKIFFLPKLDMLEL